MSNQSTTEKDQLADPVCDMTVSPDAEYSCLHVGKQYFFCSDLCLQKFKAHPEQYLEKKTTPRLENTTGEGTYTCPMHPEVIQDHPGSCPKCGMALELVTSSGEEKNEELIDMSRRFWVCTVLSLPVFVLAMTADMMPAWLPERLSMQTVQWIEFGLATPVVLWGGWPFFVRGWQSILTWNLNMFTLICGSNELQLRFCNNQFAETEAGGVVNSRKLSSVGRWQLHFKISSFCCKDH